MSIPTSIERLRAIKTRIRTNLAAQGITVPEDTVLSEMAERILSVAGEDGRGIVSMTRTSGTGESGSTDTYTITYTDETTNTFSVYNGKDGTSDMDWIPTKDWDEGSTLYEAVLSFTGSMATIPSGRTFSIQPAINYRVYWNGVLYECTGKTYDDQPYLGNGRLVHGNYVEDTGEPFGFIAKIFEHDAVYVNKSVSAPEDITVKITTGVYTYNTMPDEYLPDSVVKSVNGLVPDENGNVATGSMSPDDIAEALRVAKESGEFDGKDGSDGKDGTSVTVKSVTESSEDGGSNVVTFSDGKTVTIKNGSKGGTGATGSPGKNGADGKDGYTPVKGVDYFDGQPGRNGKDGTSVTVQSVTESTADGGNNIVTFSDGNTITVKNGSKGSAGKDGKDGSAGANGKDGNGIASAVLNVDYTLTLTFTDGTKYTSPSIRGATGATGKDGSDGTPGKTAYEYAQDVGYTGTEEEFSEMLAGGGGGSGGLPPLRIYAVKNGSSYRQEIIEGGATKTYTAAEIHELVSQRVVVLETYTSRDDIKGHGCHQYWRTSFNTNGTVNQVHFRGTYTNDQYNLVPSYVSVDSGGSIFVSGEKWAGSSVETDASLTKSNYPANAKKVGDKIAELSEQIANMGSGGGDTSIDVTASVGQTIVVKEVDANGKPTAWEAVDHQPRTHWTEEVIYIPETSLDFDGDNGYFYTSTPLSISYGDEFTVKYNGVEYDLQPLRIGDDLMLGNPVIFGYEDNGIPFAIAPLPEMTLVAPLDGSESVVVEIKKLQHHKIPSEYIDVPAVFYLDIFDGNESGTYYTNITDRDVRHAIELGRMIIVRHYYSYYYVAICVVDGFSIHIGAVYPSVDTNDSDKSFRIDTDGESENPMDAPLIIER